MIAPGILVIGTPLIGGFIFGPNATAGILAGNIVSGVQVAISQSNSGGAWDNAKKEVEKNRSKFRDEAEAAKINLDAYRREFKILEANRYTGDSNSMGLPIEVDGFDIDRWTKLNEWMHKDADLKERHVAAVVGDTVGDPLKDTSGPAINILVKLSAITSLIFGGYLENYHIFENPPKIVEDSAYILNKCNSAGENPDSSMAVMSFCTKQFMAGKLGNSWDGSTAAPAAPATK